MGLERGQNDGNQEITEVKQPVTRNISKVLERRLAKRAEEIKNRIKQSEVSQRCTNETMNLEFHTPGLD